ncbi:Short-chain dehydrogenase [Alteromonadaceae bacterium Bs31]|nr:Short-chain dehydrogenase [Alteromonadaceae bacterium Bs31]
MSEKKTVVVTGCSSGIGLCAAESLAARGYCVIATVRNENDKAKLQNAGIQEVVLLDLAESASVQAAIRSILSISGGKVYALFNNGAYGQPGAVEDLSRATLRKQFETNLFGTHELTVGLLPAMLKLKDARIVQNSSVLGFVAMPLRGAYNASKFALEGLTDTLRLELKGSSVKVSIIQPGPIISRFRANALRALEQEVDFGVSRHKEKYQQALLRLKKPGPAAPFTLPATAVVQKVIHAIESPRPRYRYKVTFATYLMAFLRAILPAFLMDKVLVRGGQ